MIKNATLGHRMLSRSIQSQPLCTDTTLPSSEACEAGGQSVIDEYHDQIEKINIWNVIKTARVFDNSTLINFWTGLLAETKHLDQTEIPDDSFLWLEEVEGVKALEWVNRQNELTVKELEMDPRYIFFKETLEQFYNNKERIPYGTAMGKYVYNFWRDETNIRGVWRRTSISEYEKKDIVWEIVLDLDKLAKDEGENWVDKGFNCFPHEYKRCLLNLSRGGKDAVVAREFDTEKKEFVEGGFFLPEAKSTVEWLDENTLLAGTDTGPDSLTESGYPRKVGLWRRGEPFSEAEMIFEGEKKDVIIDSTRFYRDESNTIFLKRRISRFEVELYLLTKDVDLIKLPVPLDSSVQGIFHGYVLLTLRSPWKPSCSETEFPHGSLVAAKLSDLVENKNGKVETHLLYGPNSRTSIRSVYAVRNSIFVGVLNNVTGALKQIKRTGSKDDMKWSISDVSVPKNGAIYIMDSNGYSDKITYAYENFLTPTTLSTLDGETCEQSIIKTLKSKFDMKGLIVEQEISVSKDGTEIPYFIVRRKNIKYDGSNPTLLYGYGGFEHSLIPFYSPEIGKLWLENGGVFVLANIRGGGEFGPEWHKAAMKENRQRAFDDFISIAEEIISKKITSPRRLGIQGGSNGGLLVGAVFTQRPELFNAVICKVPLLDMLRYSKLLAGASWTGEFGDPDDEKMRSILQEYSPYHNVSRDKKYPEVFFTTSTRDDRVHPGHARKMVAKMQSLGHKVYYFENAEGGHRASANLSQRARLAALEYVYLYKKLFD